MTFSRILDTADSNSYWLKKKSVLNKNKYDANIVTNSRTNHRCFSKRIFFQIDKLRMYKLKILYWLINQGGVLDIGRNLLQACVN